MGGIGAPELIVLGIISLAVLLVVVVVVRLISRATSKTAGLVTCRACKKPISPRASSCPSCGEPRALTS